MGFRRSLVRIQSPRHHKARRDFKFWRVFFFLLETDLQETLQETRLFSANFGLSQRQSPSFPELCYDSDSYHVMPMHRHALVR